MNGTWIAVGVIGLGVLCLGALIALGRLEDRPYLYDPETPQDHDWFFESLLEEPDIRDRNAKRTGREGA